MYLYSEGGRLVLTGLLDSNQIRLFNDKEGYYIYGDLRKYLVGAGSLSSVTI